MFVELIMGQVKDREGLRRQMERWQSDLLPGATGYLGSTGGVTADGTSIVLVRFASEEAARANADRPEQGAWWADTQACYEGEATFADSTDVDLFMDGGSDDAGFVQFIQGRTEDREALAQVDEVLARLAPSYRPEILGGIRVWTGGGAFTEAVYFTSEEAARAGESAERPAEAAEAMERFQAAVAGGRFVDLTDPWLHSA